VTALEAQPLGLRLRSSRTRSRRIRCDRVGTASRNALYQSAKPGTAPRSTTWSSAWRNEARTPTAMGTLRAGDARKAPGKRRARSSFSPFGTPLFQTSPVPNRVWRLLTAAGRAISTTCNSVQFDAGTGVGNRLEQSPTGPRDSGQSTVTITDRATAAFVLQHARHPVIGKALGITTY
jgi:hypothetical protein